MLGQEVNKPVFLCGLENPKPITSYDNFVQSVKEKMKTVYEVVRENIGVAGGHDTKYYDLCVKPKFFSV